MKDMYTLEECFIACGSKFPFTVEFEDRTSLSIRKFIFIERVKYNEIPEEERKRINVTDHDSWFWKHISHKIHEYAGEGYHWEYAMRQAYDYKRHLFQNDIDKLLSSEDEVR